MKWICPDCGHIHEGDEGPKEDSPICNCAADLYEQVKE